MKVYSDIHTYYPATVGHRQQIHSDFAIIRLEDLEKNLSQDKLKELSKPHLRDFFEICIGINEPRNTTIDINTTQVNTHNGHLLFVSPVQSFSYKRNPDPIMEKSNGFIIAFKAPFLTCRKRAFEVMNRFRYFSSYTFPQHLLIPSRLEKIMEIAQNIYQEYHSKEQYSNEIIMGYMEVLLYSFNRWLQLDEHPHKNKATELLTINFEREIIADGNRINTISNYAQRLNVSAPYLSECIKKTTGKTAKQILLNHKLIIAKSLLEEKEKSIADIAYEMNFTEPTNFSKFFKQASGVTPNQFRKQN